MNCLKCRLWFFAGDMLSKALEVLSGAYDYCMLKSLSCDKEHKCDQWKDITDAE